MARYIPKSGEVEAFQRDDGSYVVVGTDGQTSIVPANEFGDKYVPVTGAGAATGAVPGSPAPPVSPATGSAPVAPAPAPGPPPTAQELAAAGHTSGTSPWSSLPETPAPDATTTPTEGA
jgi:hypothetical protein